MAEQKKAQHPAPRRASADLVNTYERLLATVSFRDAGKCQPEYLQAVTEVLVSLRPLLEKRPDLVPMLDALIEPERTIMFRVTWEDDKGNMHVNRGYRVQQSSALGPYKGGLRFTPTVTAGVLRFLAFEQVLKNALTGLAMGGGKGGSDFNPKGRSDAEVRRFCQAFMKELSRHIGPDTDVPAGDLNVGGRELGFLYGEYHRNVNLHGVGAITGKGISYGGSLGRTEATGFGTVYLAEHLMRAVSGKKSPKKGKSPLAGKRFLVSGSGNVAQHVALKLLQLGGIPVTFSDSGSYIYEEKGFTMEQVQQVMKIKAERKRLTAYESKTVQRGDNPRDLWQVDAKAELAFPSATQNEIDVADIKALMKNGVKGVVEGANMPCTNEAVSVMIENKMLYLPGKAANAGGVAVSGLEMAQNSQRLTWSFERVDEELQKIMAGIFHRMTEASKAVLTFDDPAELYQARSMQFGANAAGFLRVAEAMRAQGDFF